jgi:hypothetical protein
MATSIVISQLKQKRDEIQRAIYELEIKLRDARTDIATVNAALRIFGEDAGEPREYSNRVKLFANREMARIIYDALRDAPEGLDTVETAEIVMRSKGFDTADKTTFAKVKHSVCNAMLRAAREGKVAEGGVRNGIRVWRRST